MSFGFIDDAVEVACRSLWVSSLAPTRDTTKKDLIWVGTLTPGDLPLSAFSNTEGRRGRAHVDSDPPTEDKENHLHLPRVLDALLAARWYANHARAEEWESESFGELECCGLDVAKSHGVGGESNLCKYLISRKNRESETYQVSSHIPTSSVYSSSYF